LALNKRLRFDDYVAEALYGESGFYTVAGRAGRRGDFITSPEVGPLFGAVLARWIEAEFDRLGQPADFRVVEVGAGPGTLARAILQVAPQWSGRYSAVELSAAQRASHPDGVDSLAVLADEQFCGVIIANELLDNLPFRLAVFDGGWREAVVESGGDGSLREHLVAAPADWGWLPPTAPHGARVPVEQRAGALISDLLSQLIHGTLLAFDYFTARTSELAAAPWREWLRTYRGHERGGHYLRDPGLQDITAQVCIDQLPSPTDVCTQAEFLRRWGIDELVAEGRAQWTTDAAAPTLASLRMRSRIAEAESLLDPSGLGGFYALEWRTDSATVVSR
jgi:SAM-dependent MidA family methyltransferase